MVKREGLSRKTTKGGRSLRGVNHVVYWNADEGGVAENTTLQIGEKEDRQDLLSSQGVQNKIRVPRKTENRGKRNNAQGAEEELKDRQN